MNANIKLWNILLGIDTIDNCGSGVAPFIELREYGCSSLAEYVPKTEMLLF